MIKRLSTKKAKAARGGLRVHSEIQLADEQSNRLALKALRTRAQVSAEDCAKALGYKGPTSYLRYENDKSFDGNPIPATVVMGIIPLLVGKGSPPVRMDELLSISELKGVERLLVSVQTRSVMPSARESGEFLRNVPQLMVKYRLERGTYRDSTRTLQPDYGVSPLMPLRSFPQDHQWCAVIHDEHASMYGISRGTVLHCVDLAGLAPSAVAPGCLVVVAHRRDGLIEYCLAAVASVGEGRTPQLKIGSENITGDILGLAVYRYGPVTIQNV